MWPRLTNQFAATVKPHHSWATPALLPLPPIPPSQVMLLTTPHSRSLLQGNDEFQLVSFHVPSLTAPPRVPSRAPCPACPRHTRAPSSTRSRRAGKFRGLREPRSSTVGFANLLRLNHRFPRDSFLPGVREFTSRHTAYNKHDTGWAKGAPSEDHTTSLSRVVREMEDERPFES